MEDPCGWWGLACRKFTCTSREHGTYNMVRMATAELHTTNPVSGYLHVHGHTVILPGKSRRGGNEGGEPLYLKKQ